METPLLSMSDEQNPAVNLIKPSSSLSGDHHGSFGRPCLPLTPENKTRYFKNPWTSYRATTLSDAWQAYQKGAAVVPHPLKTPRPSRRNSRHNLAIEEEEGDDIPARAEQAALLNGNCTVRIPIELARVLDEDEEDDWRDPPVLVREPDWGGREDKVRTTWLGHAGTLVRIPWKRNSGRGGMCGVLFDPIFSYRCSPSQYIGPARYLNPPCLVSELPPIHICCISHDHYDHLDYYTIIDLWKFHRQTIHFFVPLGLKTWFTSSGISSDRITELDWWHEAILSFPSSPPFSSSSTSSLNTAPSFNDINVESDLTLKIAFTPAQHRSGRGVLYQMTTLWGSWCLGVVEEGDVDKVDRLGMKDWEGFKCYFGGDTGYRYATAPEGDETAICPAFREIANLYSPFNLSFLPLSTGSSLPFLRTLLGLSLHQYTLTSSLHCSPDDALELHRILRSERTVGVHWGTFCDADEARGTRVEFGRSRRMRGVSGEWEDDDQDGDDDEDGDGEGRGDGVVKGKGNGNGRFVVVDIGETLVMP